MVAFFAEILFVAAPSVTQREDLLVLPVAGLEGRRVGSADRRRSLGAR